MKNRPLGIFLSSFSKINCYLRCRDIGGGLFLQHAFSTVVDCRHIGTNCWINQQVTIGHNSKNSSPYIGNDVVIYAGAKVIGNITIGDDVIIGANAVVINDVPSHSIVVGVPARVVKTRASQDEEWRRVNY